eukprot:7300313-Prymnesium_polylepis.1
MAAGGARTALRLLLLLGLAFRLVVEVVQHALEQLRALPPRVAMEALELVVVCDQRIQKVLAPPLAPCLLYTSDAADDM